QGGARIPPGEGEMASWPERWQGGGPLPGRFLRREGCAQRPPPAQRITRPTRVKGIENTRHSAAIPEWEYLTLSKPNWLLAPTPVPGIVSKYLPRLASAKSLYSRSLIGNVVRLSRLPVGVIVHAARNEDGNGHRGGHIMTGQGQPPKE